MEPNLNEICLSGIRVNAKRLALVAFLMMTYLFGIEKAFAAEHKLEQLHIHVVVDADGNARITEQRVAHLTEGTEIFIVIGNFGQSMIKDFVVIEDGMVYQSIIGILMHRVKKRHLKMASLKKEMAMKLSWGIGSYGSHKYIVEYTVTDFIKQLQDSQILF